MFLWCVFGFIDLHARLFGGSVHMVSLDDGDAGFFTEFESEVLEFELLNLAAARHGEFLDEEDVAGNLVARNFAGAELAHVEVGHLYAFVQNDECPHFLAIAL